MDVQEPEHTAEPTRWWLAAMVLTGGGAAAAAGPGLSRSLGPDWAALTALLGVCFALLVWAERRVPRRVTASASGVRIHRRAQRQEVRWDELRRVRSEGGEGLPVHDVALEVADGRLVSLPRRMPAGLVEGWRTTSGGARPPSELPQRWLLGRTASVDWRWFLSMFAAQLGFNAGVQLFGGSAAGLLASAVGLGLLLLLLHAKLPPRQVTADTEGISFGAFRQRRVPWSEVRDVRAKSRYEPVTVLERTDGSLMQVLGPPVAVVEQWRELSEPL